MSHQDVINKTK